MNASHSTGASNANLSWRRTLRLSLLLAALAGVALFTHPVLAWMLGRRDTARPDPVAMLRIYGVLQIRNASAAGVDVRIGHDARHPRSCRSLPVRARTDTEGIFYASVQHHHPSGSTAARSMVDVCLVKGPQVLEHFMLFYPGQDSRTYRFFCRYPAPDTGDPEDRVCVPADGMSFKRLRGTDWFEKKPE